MLQLSVLLPKKDSLSDGDRAQPSSKRQFRQIASRLLLLILCLPPVLLTGCAWPMYRQGSTRTARSAIDTSSNTGTVQTCFNFGEGQNEFPYGPLLGYTQVSGGIFLGDIDGDIFSVSTDCTLAWAYATGAIGATPNGVGVDGNVYATQSGGTLFAINQSGVLQWTFTPPGGMSRAELAIGQDGTIYGGSQCGVFYALNPNGSVKWTFAGFQKECPGSFNPIISPAVAGAAVGAVATIYSGVPGVLFALNTSGAQLWQSTTYTGVPAVAPNGNIYVLGSLGQQIYALNSAGFLQWQLNAVGTQTFSLPAIAPDSSFYVGTAGAGLWWVDSTGTPKWKFTPNGFASFFAPPTIGGDGTIYASSGCTATVCGSSYLFAVNPSSTLPTLKWSAILCGGLTGAVAGQDEAVIGLDGSIYMTLDFFTQNITCPLEKIM